VKVDRYDEQHAVHVVRGGVVAVSVNERRPRCTSRPRDRFRTKTTSNMPRPVTTSLFSLTIVQIRPFCFSRLVEIEEIDDERVSQEDRDVLRLEENTWGLLQALMP
jgi:hypothetical protein